MGLDWEKGGSRKGASFSFWRGTAGLGIEMENSNIHVTMESAEIQAALERIAGEILESPADPRRLVLIGIHTGGVHLAGRLKQIFHEKHGMSVPLGSLDINLYRDDWTRLHTQPLVRSTELPFPIQDCDVVLVDDVLYTGRTTRAALDAIMDYGRPKRVQLAVLVDRGHRELPIFAQFVGLSVPTEAHQQVHVLLSEKENTDRVIIETPGGEVVRR